MAGFLTHFINDQVLDCLFGGEPIVPPPTLYVGLSLDRARKGGHPVEPLGGGYRRVPVPNDVRSWPPAQWGGKANGITIRFPDPTGDWGAIAAVFVADSAAGGRVIAMCDLHEPRPVDEHSRPILIAPGRLTFHHC